MTFKPAGKAGPSDAAEASLETPFLEIPHAAWTPSPAAVQGEAQFRPGRRSSASMSSVSRRSGPRSRPSLSS
jgi:hypothetical protein